MADKLLSTTPAAVAANLARNLGDPAHDLVILAEGNVSLLANLKTMVVKATGVAMAEATPEDFVSLDLAEVLTMIVDPDSGDETVDRIFSATQQREGKRPSVEALLHAVCLDLEGVTVVGHTHPIAVNAVLCSLNAPDLVAGSLFPDQIVVIGTNPMLVPYVDPGLKLAQLVRERLRSHIVETGSAPRAIYLSNHGMFALGSSPSEVEQIISMAVKVAKVLLGAHAAGGPVYLDSTETQRIDTRPDEEHRRQLLKATAAGE